MPEKFNGHWLAERSERIDVEQPLRLTAQETVDEQQVRACASVRLPVGKLWHVKNLPPGSREEAAGMLRSLYSSADTVLCGHTVIQLCREGHNPARPAAKGSLRSASTSRL